MWGCTWTSRRRARCATRRARSTSRRCAAPGRKHTIGMFVMALPLKGVMLSYNNTASAMLVAAGATVVGNGVLARAEGANVVFSQLAPWQFDYSGEKRNVKRTFRRVACLSARLLANMGAARGTPLVARFADPAGAGEKRWLDGLYLDVPEEWDDPYRFFRWEPAPSPAAILHKLSGEPPAPRGSPPGPACRQRNRHHPHCGEPTGASAADRGSAPQSMQTVRYWEKYAALARQGSGQRRTPRPGATPGTSSLRVTTSVP